MGDLQRSHMLNVRCRLLRLVMGLDTVACWATGNLCWYVGVSEKRTLEERSRFWKAKYTFEDAFWQARNWFLDWVQVQDTLHAMERSHCGMGDLESPASPW